MFAAPPTFLTNISETLHTFSKFVCGLDIIIRFSVILSLRYIVDLVIFGGFLKGGGHKFSEFACYFCVTWVAWQAHRDHVVRPHRRHCRPASLAASVSSLHFLFPFNTF